MSIKKVNNEYQASLMESSDYSAVGGRIKKNKTSIKYKGGMLSELSPAEFRGYAGCANWARGGARKSRKLRRMLKKGGTTRKTHETILTRSAVKYDEPLYGGRKRRNSRKNRKSRRY
jgi:hypothetical protein